MEPNKSNNTLIFALIIAAVISVMVSMIIVSKKSKSLEQPVVDLEPSPVTVVATTGTTSLSFSPAVIDAFPGELITVNAYMNTNESLINGVELKTVYDPNVFEVTKFTKKPAMNALAQEIKNDIDNTTGIFSYSAFGLDKELFLNGSNLFLFTLDVKVKESAPAGEYTFDFNPSTIISASGAGKNVFQRSIPQKITVSP